ncbi:MAG TPA: hypothetical protein VG329_10310 [Candidatus Dormibacteraeota bacterium]|jgi:hypothetical protein|nr:hypothetical protein [Candidatus Dormibacteraeota bacterium]
MSDRDPTGQHPEDLPWNDVPADSDVLPGSEEPEPAEVGGTEDDDAAFDSASHAAPDIDEKYRRDTLDQRLAEEVPDRPERGADPDVSVYGADEDDEAGAAEADDDESDADDQSAEESAMHLTDEP